MTENIIKNVFYSKKKTLKTVFFLVLVFLGFLFIKKQKKTIQNKPGATLLATQCCRPRADLLHIVPQGILRIDARYLCWYLCAIKPGFNYSGC